MNRCSHMTVDSATATSQNRFSSCKLSLHKKTILFRIWQNITYLYYFNLLSRDRSATILLYDKFLEFCLPVLWCSLCKIHRYVAFNETVYMTCPLKNNFPLQIKNTEYLHLPSEQICTHCTVLYMYQYVDHGNIYTTINEEYVHFCM